MCKVTFLSFLTLIYTAQSSGIHALTEQLETHRSVHTHSLHTKRHSSSLWPPNLQAPRSQRYPQPLHWHMKWLTVTDWLLLFFCHTDPWPFQGKWSSWWGDSHLAAIPVADGCSRHSVIKFYYITMDALRRKEESHAVRELLHLIYLVFKSDLSEDIYSYHFFTQTVPSRCDWGGSDFPSLFVFLSSLLLSSLLHV